MTRKTTKEEMRRWVAAWESYDREAAELRSEELRKMSLEESAEVSDMLLRGGAHLLRLRPSSGLIEQQKDFGKVREKMRSQKGAALHP